MPPVSPPLPERGPAARRRGLLRVLLCFCALLLGRPALATTVAVLPLTRASASEQYDGLGQALAGMLVSDLSTAPSLRLVERARLDDIMAEIGLSQTGFLDPATAQKLGRGLGAEVVLTGSYSVVADQFLIDARLVRVESGEVLKAADHQGSLAEFVAVEKALVEDLLGGLDVVLSMGQRRTLMLQAPTEDFGAFSAFGEGLARRQEGALEAARVAFERALSRDPAFEEARLALTELQGLLEQARAEQRLVADAWLDARYRRVLAETTDERTRPRGFTHDGDSFAAFVLRQGVLADAGLQCQRSEELYAFLDHSGWQVAAPQVVPVVGFRLRGLMEEFDLLGAELYEARRRVGRTGALPGLELFDSTTQLVMGSRSQYLGREGDGLVDAVLACAPQDAWDAELDQVLVAATDAGQAARVDDRSGLALDTLLSLLWSWQHARLVGADAALNRRTKHLLDRTPPGPTHDALMGHLEAVQREAQERAAYEAATLGLDEDRIEQVMQALSDRDPALLKLDDPTCAWLADNQVGSARRWVVGLQDDRQETPGERRFSHLRLRYKLSGVVIGPVRDLGCLRDEPGRFTGWADVSETMLGLQLSPEAERDGTCVQLAANLERSLRQPAADPALFAQSPQLESGLVWGAMTMYYSLVTQRCVPLPERR